MIGILLAMNVMLIVLSIFTFSTIGTTQFESHSLYAASNNFTLDLKSKINSLISNALNDSTSLLNSTNLITTNESNSTSSNVIISKNKITSSVTTNGTGSSSSGSIIKDQVKTINGECTSIKVGGNGNDTLTSSGNCNDELTGGAGADKFMCGEGNDTVRDYNSKEGDIILDKQNCENIL